MAPRFKQNKFFNTKAISDASFPVDDRSNLSLLSYSQGEEAMRSDAISLIEDKFVQEAHKSKGTDPKEFGHNLIEKLFSNLFRS